MIAGPARFPIRFGIFRWLLSLIGAGPRASYAELSGEVLRVRMGWTFRARIPIGSVTRAHRDGTMRWGVGVHGWRGRWLVNGSTKGIATVEIDPPVRAFVCGFPVRLRRLHVSLDDPDGFVAALGRG
jgi:hypothetical protein